MEMEQHTLVTIVTEASLEHPMIADLERLGARGWTVTDARGKGTEGQREPGIDTIGNIRIEVVCDPPVADRIAEHVSTTYFEGYATVLYLSDVRVIRGEKF
jgi:hypothetical protein